MKLATEWGKYFTEYSLNKSEHEIKGKHQKFNKQLLNYTKDYGMLQ